MSERQCQRIERQQQDPGARHALLDKIHARHEHAGNRFEIREVPDRDVLVVPAELLVRQSAISAPDIEEIIDQASFTIRAVSGLDGRVARLHKTDATREEVDGLQEELESAGVAASFSYLTPTKVIMKAEATPEHATAPRPRTADVPGADTSSVSVVVLDTGIALCDRTDGWLRGLENEDNRDPLDVFPAPNGLLDFAAGHGTFIAGLYQLVDTGLNLQVRRTLDTDGIVSEVDLGCALVDCVRDNLDVGSKLVVNLSLGTDTVDDEPPLALEVALEIVRELESDRDAEVMLVAAAGNDGLPRHCWPAAFADQDERVIAVAALNADLSRAAWSSHGGWVTCSAVGESVESVFVTGREDPEIDPDGETFGRNAWASWTGTSFAAPQVAARIASIARTQDVSLGEAKSRLFDEAGFANDPNYGTLLRLTS